jgi:hypothetical protein
MKTALTLTLGALMLVFVAGVAFAEDPQTAPPPEKAAAPPEKAAPDKAAPDKAAPADDKTAPKPEEKAKTEPAPPAPDKPKDPAANGGGEEKDGMKILKETQDLMKQLAETLLPNVNKADNIKVAQDKEKNVVKNFDALIKMIIDQGAEEQQQQQQQEQQQEQKEQKEGEKQKNPQNSGKKEEKKSQPGQPKPQAGKQPKGNPFGKGGPDDSTFEGNDKNEWGLLPDREYKESVTVGGTIVPRGYETLLERFRRTIGREGLKVHN